MKKYPALLALFFVSLSLFAQKELLNFKHPGWESKLIAYSPDSKYMLIAGPQTICIYYAGTDDEIGIIKTRYKEINACLFTPDSKYIISAGRDNINGTHSCITIWDAEKKTEVKKLGGRPKDKEIFALAISENGKYLFSAGKDSVIKQWDMETGNQVGSYSGNSKPTLALDVTSDSRYMASAGGDEKIFIREISSGALIKTIPKNSWIRALKFVPNTKLLVSGADNGNIYINDISGRDSAGTLLGDAKKRVYALSISGDGKYVVSSSIDKSFTVWHLEDKTIYSHTSYKKGGTVISNSISPDGKYLAILHYGNRDARIFDIKDLNITPAYKLKNKDDKNPPQIYISAPANLRDIVKTSKDLLNIKGSIIDESGVQKLIVNGIETPLKDNGNFTIWVPLTPGSNNIVIQATDINNNTSLRKFTAIRKDMSEGEDSTDIKNYLLVIGINNYIYWPKLNNAVKDAKDVVSALMTLYSFDSSDVTLLTDSAATRNTIYKTLRSYIEKVRPQDNFLLYYSGHGMFDELLNEGYWIPYDAQIGNEGDYLANSSLLKILQNINSKHTFLVADACFSGALFSEASRGYVENVSKYKSRWGLASGRLEKVSDGQSGTNSPFASSFIDYLKQNKKESFPVSEIIQYVKVKVAETSNQTPMGNPLKNVGDEGGEFIFYKRK